MNRTQNIVGFTVIAAATAVATWAMAVPVGIADILDRPILSVQGVPGAISMDTRPENIDEIPQGSILIFGENGTLDAVVTDDKTRALQIKNEPLHDL